MDLIVEPLDADTKRVLLKGRMDIAGADSISVPLAVHTAAEKTNLVFDLSGVDFMASVGIGILVRSVKALRLRGGDAVILNPQEVVALVLKHTQIDAVIPVVYDLQSALDTLKKKG